MDVNTRPTPNTLIPGYVTRYLVHRSKGLLKGESRGWRHGEGVGPQTKVMRQSYLFIAL